MAADMRTEHSGSVNLKNSLDRGMVLKDNPSVSHLNEINKYIKQLDTRLSVPKFTKADEEGNSPIRITKDLSMSPGSGKF